MPKPLKTFRSPAAPGVAISVWDGEKGTNFSIRKSYKKQDGTYADSTTFFAADLAALMALVPSVLGYTAELKAQRGSSGGQSVDGDRIVDRASERYAKAEATSSTMDDDDIPF